MDCSASRLFEEYPEYKKLFPQLRNLTDIECMNSNTIHAIAVDKFMKGLADMIEHMEDIAHVKERLERIAVVHKRHHMDKHHIMVRRGMLGKEKAMLIGRWPGAWPIW